MKYESHITIEPVFDDRLKVLELLVGDFGFRVADLLFKKRATETATRSDKDTFCTAKSDDLRSLQARTNACVAHLMAAKFDVWRYKLEETLLDVRLKPKNQVGEISK